jgi:predicted DNA-binding ribbon-helix-helix protein
MCRPINVPFGVSGSADCTAKLPRSLFVIGMTISNDQGASLAQTLTEIDTTRQQKNLSSAIRLFVLGHVRDQKMRAAFKAAFSTE